MLFLKRKLGLVFKNEIEREEGKRDRHVRSTATRRYVKMRQNRKGREGCTDSQRRTNNLPQFDDMSRCGQTKWGMGGKDTNKDNMSNCGQMKGGIWGMVIRLWEKNVPQCDMVLKCGKKTR